MRLRKECGLPTKPFGGAKMCRGGSSQRRVHQPHSFLVAHVLARDPRTSRLSALVVAVQRSTDPRLAAQ